MKILIKYLLMISIVLILSGTSHAIHEIIPSESGIAMPKADAKEIIEYIIKYEPYRSWRIWPGMNKLTPAHKPHGYFATIFVNDIAYLSIKKRRGMADGSFIVMENYGREKNFLGLSVMYKIAKHNPEGGDWFWSEFKPDGSISESGKVESCLSCHGEVKANDYIKSRRIIHR